MLLIQFFQYDPIKLHRFLWLLQGGSCFDHANSVLTAWLPAIKLQFYHSICVKLKAFLYVDARGRHIPTVQNIHRLFQLQHNDNETTMGSTPHRALHIAFLHSSTNFNSGTQSSLPLHSFPNFYRDLTCSCTNISASGGQRAPLYNRAYTCPNTWVHFGVLIRTCPSTSIHF